MNASFRPFRYRSSTTMPPTISSSRGVMSLEDTRRSQKPYRYGMILLCFGALINWLGLAENYSDPVRYAGVACIIGGALLICVAMCCWLHTPARNGVGAMDSDDPAIHVISIPPPEIQTEKPPEYDTVVISPPSYDDAIKLNPANLFRTANCKVNSEVINIPSVSDTTNDNNSQILNPKLPDVGSRENEPTPGCLNFTGRQ